jgi:hypothetical protein
LLIAVYRPNQFTLRRSIPVLRGENEGRFLSVRRLLLDAMRLRPVAFRDALSIAHLRQQLFGHETRGGRQK